MLDDLIRLAHEKPETRKHLVPLIRRHLAVLKYGGSCFRVSGNQRSQYADAVWAMFVRTYSRIGLILSSPSQLSKYAPWEICLDKGEPVAFALFKKTAFGLKVGLAGSDGSSTGKHITVNNIRTVYHRSGFYGEVSHKVEAIALASGAPVVCASDVSAILGKPVTPKPDGLHYTRSISGIGAVTKIMVGRPKGVPITDPKAPACLRSSVPQLSSLFEETDETFDFLVHHACEMQD